jgi:hydroxymethylglutaryl-CoA lyase
MEKAIITDVTLREFGQNVPGSYLHLFTPEIRIQIASALRGLGFRNMEVFSCVHPNVAPAMGEAAIRKIAAGLGRMDGVHIITLVPNLAGYRSFLRLDLGPDGFNHTMGIFFSAVEAHNRANLRRTIKETLAEYRSILEDAASRHIRVAAYISAAFGYLHPEKGEVIRPDLRDVNRWMDILFGWGASTVTLSDLQGVAGNNETARTLETILDLGKGKDRDRIGYHPHHISRDRALENSMAAFKLGIRRFDGSLGGTGGCVTGAPGNQPTEGLVRLFHEGEIETGIDETGVADLAETVQRDLYGRISFS